MKDAREHILFTAFKLILRKGYANVSMSELVATSNLSKGAFYHYFNSKEDLYHETMNKYFFSYMESFELHYNREITFDDNINGLCDNYISMMKEISNLIGSDDVIISYYQTIMDGIKRSPRIKSIMAGYYDHYINEIANWIKIGQEDGVISNKLNPEHLSMHISSLMEGFMLMNIIQISMEQIETDLKLIITQFLYLIKNQ